MATLERWYHAYKSGNIEALRGPSPRSDRGRCRELTDAQRKLLVNILDVGTLSSSMPYMVMEYLEGADFASILAQRGRLCVPETLEYFLQILEGLTEAHDAGIIHRDLKPANVFLAARSEQFPLVKVLDFGISKTLSPVLTTGNDLTSPTAVLGSPLYMPPELLRDARSVDVRSDIWALGILLYEFLVGHPPFDGSSLRAAMLSITNDRPKPISTVRAGVPPELEAVIERCLAKDPADRYSSIRELANALRPLATTPACQVSLAHIFKLGTSMPPTATPRREAPTSTRIRIDGFDAGRTASSLRPIQATHRPARVVKRNTPLLMMLGAGAAVSLGLVERRWLTIEEPGASAQPAAIVDERKTAPLELAEIVLTVPMPTPLEGGAPSRPGDSTALSESTGRVVELHSARPASPPLAGASFRPRLRRVTPVARALSTRPEREHQERR